jgi:predicted dithiol-disulfide oxidoreductase (DUF899 family)
MWRWDEDQGCPSCSFLVDNIGHLSHLHARDTSLAVVARGPLAETDRFRERMGWTVPWYSSFGSDFNYDFHVTLDETVAPAEYNYRNLDELGEDWKGWSGEQPGTSAFLRHGSRVFHTHSSYARGGDLLLGTYNWLDLTARGRQEDWQEPAGRPEQQSFHGLATSPRQVRHLGQRGRAIRQTAVARRLTRPSRDSRPDQ